MVVSPKTPLGRIYVAKQAVSQVRNQMTITYTQNNAALLSADLKWLIRSLNLSNCA